MATSGCEKSTWTPLNHAPANHQLFRERLDLVKRWFNHWTDSQRAVFLETLLPSCRKPQLDLLDHRLVANKPIENLDFTRCLPRCISLYIFTFLDPRSLCRASRVCWYWKLLTEVDGLWAPKCLRFGWQLSRWPSEFEQGAWKRLYIERVKELRCVPAPVEVKVEAKKKPAKLKAKVASEIDVSKLVWRDPDKKPIDLEKFSRKLITQGWEKNEVQRRKATGKQLSITQGRSGDIKTDETRSFQKTTLSFQGKTKDAPMKKNSKNLEKQTTKTSFSSTESVPHAEGVHQTKPNLSSATLNVTQSDSALLSTEQDLSTHLQRISISRPKTPIATQVIPHSQTMGRSLQDLPSASLFANRPVTIRRFPDNFP